MVAEATTRSSSCHARTRMVSPGEHHAGEPGGEAADPGRVPAEELVGEQAQDDAVGAEAVQDRCGESGGLREVGVGMQRVAVAAEPVEQRLLRGHVVRRVGVRRPVRELDLRPTRRGLPPAAFAADEDRRPDGPQLVAVGAVAVPSCQITAALPLSQTSVTRVRSVAVPEVGRGAFTEIDCDPCTTCARSMSQPGRSSGGGSVSWKVGATIAERRQHLQPRVRRACSAARRGRGCRPGEDPAPMPRW